MVPTIQHSVEGKTTEVVKWSEVTKGKENRRKNTEDFKVVKIFCMILSWWIHVIINFSQSIECTKSEP
jgi:hypothetical protein